VGGAAMVPHNNRRGPKGEGFPQGCKFRARGNYGKNVAKLRLDYGKNKA
jgi:hypothetical protein